MRGQQWGALVPSGSSRLGGSRVGVMRDFLFFLASVSQSQSGSCIPPSKIPSAMVNLPVAGLLTLRPSQPSSSHPPSSCLHSPSPLPPRTHIDCLQPPTLTLYGSCFEPPGRPRHTFPGARCKYSSLRDARTLILYHFFPSLAGLFHQNKNSSTICPEDFFSCCSPSLHMPN